MGINGITSLQCLLKSYSQLNQDINVLTFLKFKRNGYFVDIGAYDGITLSNTYKLEKEYGFKGICFEPLPEIFDSLKRNRNCILIDDAVYSKSGLTLDFSVKDYKMLSGLCDDLNIYKNVKTNSIIKKKTVTLTEILEKYNAPLFIDYLSIDTEGSEYEILKGIDFNKYTFGYITIEHNYVEPNRTNIRNLLTSFGYKFFMNNKWDDDYVKIF